MLHGYLVEGQVILQTHEDNYLLIKGYFGTIWLVSERKRKNIHNSMVMASKLGRKR